MTLDTNVVLASLLSRNGASHLIVQSILEEKLNIALTTSVALEYDDVLKRQEILEKLDLTRSHIEDVIDLFVLLAEKHAIYYRLRPNLLDENDNLFVECAFASNSQFLVTSNVKDFRRSELKSYPFTVITPGDFYHLWRCENE